VLGDERVEGRQVARFLLVHVLHEGPQVWLAREDRGGLRLVDERCGELAGLVDAQGRGEEGLLGGGEGLEFLGGWGEWLLLLLLGGGVWRGREEACVRGLWCTGEECALAAA
jgi:hypothetical protein